MPSGRPGRTSSLCRSGRPAAAAAAATVLSLLPPTAPLCHRRCLCHRCPAPPLSLPGMRARTLRAGSLQEVYEQRHFDYLAAELRDILPHFARHPCLPAHTTSSGARAGVCMAHLRVPLRNT